MYRYFVALLLIFSSEVVTSNNVKTVFDPTAIRTFTMPDSCKSKGLEFCFDNENYPVDIVEDVLKDMTNWVVSNDNAGPIPSYSDRQGGSSDEDDCRSNSKNDSIYYIVDEAGNDRVVVQLEGKFEQRFSVTWCDEEGPISTRTTHFLKSMVTKYQLSCHNKYMNYDFVVLSSEPDMSGKWKLERVKTKTGIPVCCACRYEKE
ncbi:unnamed protein product [Arctia plantaginis]|uniref:Uncharacterized protein n=1 Tax=Arctia plantaginis TaxID=874455 RepID=A0A8S0Z214_ARCPL|nr:unnamed protein product [Arctia plantaginis]